MMLRLALLNLLLALSMCQAYYSRSKCTRMCPCYYQSLFCRGYGFTALPSDLSWTVENIDFQDNELTALDNQMLANFTNLRKLLLGSNKISTLSENSLSTQGQLSALDLSDNLLDDVSLSVFDPIRKKLEHLTLEGNNVTKVTGLFRNMKILKTLNLKHNNIKHVSLETFYQNRKLQFLQLAYNNISTLPEDTFKRQAELVYLYLDHNPFNISKLIIRSKDLATLSMSHCLLESIPKGMPKSLKQLNLAGNLIQSVDRNDLASLVKLNSIDLSANQISHMDSKALRNLHSLQVLYMSDNKLGELPKRLPSTLVQLALDRNLLSFLPRNSFTSTYRLRELSLDNNMLEYIHKKAFRNLTDLQSLSLHRNVLTRIPGGQFRELLALKTLDLSDNPWHTLEPGCLDGLWGLDSLAMANTPSKLKVKTGLLSDSPALRILNIHNSEAVAEAILKWDAPMHNLRSIIYLDLMRNNLPTLKATFPQTVPNIKTIQLSANPWSCDRDLYWLQNWITNGYVEEPHLNHIYCESPQALRGKRLIDMDPYDWARDYNEITKNPPW